MNIIRSRQEERQAKINRITETLQKAKKDGVDIDKKKLISMCCSEWGMSERVIKEYLKIAEFNITDMEKIDYRAPGSELNA